MGVDPLDVTLAEGQTADDNRSEDLPEVDDFEAAEATPGNVPSALAEDLEPPPPLAPSTSSVEEQSAHTEKAKSLPVTGEIVPLIDPSTLPELAMPGAPRELAPFAVRAPDDELDYWQATAQDYEREAGTLGSDPRAALLYLEVGRIYEEQLGKPRNAATSYQKAFTIDSQNPVVLHASRRLFTEVGNWNMVLEILGYEIECADSPEKRAALLAEKGIILEDKLRDVDRAQAAYSEALGVHSAEPVALNALERLYLYRKEHGQLAEVYRRALEVTGKPERRLPLLLAAAQLAEDRLEDPDTAISHYRAVLEHDPENVLALEALRRLTLQTERWEAYVEVLVQSAEVAASSEEAAQHLLAAARIQTEKREQVDRALLTLLKALEYAPEDLVLLREIELLYEQNDRYDEVVKVLRREAEVTTDARERVPILFKLGTVLEQQLQRPDDAAAVLQEAVNLMPSYVPAKQALGRLYGRLQRWEELARLFEMEIRIEEDASGRVAKLFKLAELRANRLDREDEAIASIQELLTIQQDYQPARKYLQQLLARREEWARLVDLYEQEIQQSDDKDQRIFLLTRIGTLAEEKLNSLELAERAYSRILEMRPGHLMAIRTLARLATAREDWEEVLRLYELEVEATDDQKEVVSLLHQAGVVREERLGDVSGAMEQYEKVLTLNPTYLPALRSLGRIYHRERRWSDLLGMYQRELEASRSPDQRVALLFSIAGVQQEELGDDDGAAECLEQVLEMQPGNLPALRALGEIHGRRGRDEALVEVLKRESDSLSDPKDKAETLMRVAGILEERLDRADQAAEVYQEILRLGTRVENAVRALVRIYTSEGLWNALSRALKTALEHTQSDAQKAAILLRLAEVAADKLGNRDGAAEYLETALELQPDNPMILNQLERLSVARRAWRRAIEVAKQLAHYESDPRLYAARQIRVAQMKETQIEPAESGAEHYRLALETVPDHPLALRALELAYRRAGDWGALAKFYQREALVTKEEDRRAALFARAGDVAEHRLRDDSFAAEMYERSLEVDARNLPALRGRRRVAEHSGDAEVALDSIRRESELTTDETRVRELLFEAGRLYLDQFGLRQRAIETFEQVLQRAPDHRGAFGRLESIYVEAEDFEALFNLLVRRADAVADPEEQAQLYLSAAETARSRLSDPDRAMALYRKVLERDHMEPQALTELGPLLFERQDWDGAIDIFHRTLAVSKEPAVLLQSFKALGIIYQEHRQDLVKCVQSFQAALQADPSNTECLRRLATVYRDAQDWNSSVNVLLRLADVEEDTERKVATLLELGEVYEVGLSDNENAILAQRKVLEIEPTNQSAILRLSDLYEKLEDWQALADVTAQYVGLLPPEQKEKAAPLHLKMAQVFETKLSDDSRAVNALKYALDARPNDVEALERLARLYSKSPETDVNAIETHRRLLALDPFRVDSYHEIHRMFERRGEHDKAFVAAEILVFLRAQAQDEDLYYLEHKSKVAPHAEGSLSAADHDRLVTHPNERGPTRAVLEILSSELQKIYPGELSRYDLKGSSAKHGSRSSLPMRRLADELAHALGGTPQYDLWITQVYDLDLFIENERPLALIVGRNLGRRIQDRDQRFLLSRELERMKGGHHLLSHVPLKELEALIWTVADLANPSFQVPVDPSTLELMQRHLKAVSSRARRALEEVGRTIPRSHVDLTRHAQAAQFTANRAGLVTTNDVEVAIRHIAKGYPDVRPVFRDAEGARQTVGSIPAVRDILVYAVSEEYFAARAKLGFSIEL